MTSFSVRPRARSRYYFLVRVFNSARAMRQHERGIDGNSVRDYRALTVRYEPHEGRGNLFGELLFTLRELTPELIAHEAAHAAEWYGRRIGRRDGETIAAATAAITAGILRTIDKSKAAVKESHA